MAALTPACMEEVAQAYADLIKAGKKTEDDVPTVDPALLARVKELDVKTHKVTVTYTNGGEVNPSGVKEVNDGGSVSIYISTYVGWRIAEILLNGVPQPIEEFFALLDIRQDYTVFVRFEET